MIFTIEAPEPDDTEQAAQALQELTSSWGHQATTLPAEPADTTGHGDDKVVDPIALAALILAIPSAALAVADLADRITKRRRAQQLIDHATTQYQQQITIDLHINHQHLPLHTLTPDRLLELTRDDLNSESTNNEQVHLDQHRPDGTTC